MLSSSQDWGKKHEYDDLERAACFPFETYLNARLAVIQKIEQMPQVAALDAGNQDDAGAVGVDALP